MLFFCFFCWLELLRREIHTESKMVKLTLLVLDTVKHGMSRRRSVISIMVAHYKTGIQYLKLWHTKIYTNAVKPCYLKTQVNWDPPPPFNISNIFIIYEIIQNNKTMFLGDLDHYNIPITIETLEFEIQCSIVYQTD